MRHCRITDTIYTKLNEIRKENAHKYAVQIEHRLNILLNEKKA